MCQNGSSNVHERNLGRSSRAQLICVWGAQVSRVEGSRGTHAHISRRLKECEIDTSHFTGRAHNKGTPSQRAHHSEILVLRTSGSRQRAYRLRRALVDAGVPYRCGSCDQGPEWNGAELKLQVDHKNRNWLDDRKENLTFLCPNCHSQTLGWCNSKGKTGLFQGT